MKKKHQKPATKNKKHNHAIVKRREPEVLSLASKTEEALIGGNLINLQPEERLSLYKATCKSLRLNPLTSPFCFILVKDWDNDTEKLILYAAKNCTDQLRAIYGITVVPGSLKQWREDGMLKASISVKMKNGRTDSDIGIIPMERYSRSRGSYKLQGIQLANAEMHVVTKAKRRATLSICGLGGIVDESELDTMRVIGGVSKDGRIFRYEQEPDHQEPPPKAELQDTPQPPADACLFYVWDEAKKLGYITGHQQLLTENKKLLLFKGRWSKEDNAVVVDGPTLEDLKYHFEQRSVPFKPLKLTEAKPSQPPVREPGQEG